MQYRKLGPLEVSALGLGCMGMSDFYGGRDEAVAFAAIHHALDRGRLRALPFPSCRDARQGVRCRERACPVHKVRQVSSLMAGSSPGP